MEHLGGISILINKREKVLGPIPIEAKTEEDDNASMKRKKDLTHLVRVSLLTGALFLLMK